MLNGHACDMTLASRDAFSNISETALLVLGDDFADFAVGGRLSRPLRRHGFVPYFAAMIAVRLFSIASRVELSAICRRPLADDE